MVCEFCGGSVRELARTQRQVWFGCTRCHRTWKENAAIGGDSSQPAAEDHRPVATASSVRGCLVAVLAVALAFAVRMALKPFIAFASPFLVFTPAVAIAAVYGGMIPGVLATGLGAALGNHYFLQALGEPGLERWDRNALFVLVGALITWVAVKDRNARAQLAASLWREQTARAEAEAANQTKDEFLALVSHELQTPASVMLGWASMLRARTLTGVAFDRAIEAIERNARLEAKLVADVLDTSRIASGTLRLDRRAVELGPIVAAAVEQIRPSTDERRLHLDAAVRDEDCTVLGDPVRLQQVFTNLLSNAVKFTPPGGSVRVMTAGTASEVRVTIADTGVGIEPRFQPRLFQRFQQDPETLSRSRSGLGLGLSIARHFVERHNGTITVESAGRGRGTTFTVVLPRHRPELLSGEQTGRQAAPDALRSVSVLLVEDDPDTRLVLTSILEEHGARVTAVGSAETARMVASRVQPDVMLCDLRLPTDDGVSLLQSLRSDGDEHIASIPAASLTASIRPEERERALAAGFQVHLQKPIDADRLVSVVLALISGPGHRAELVH